MLAVTVGLLEYGEWGETNTLHMARLKLLIGR